MGFRPQRRAGLAFQEVPHGIVVVDGRTLKGHALEASAAQVWMRCDGTLALPALAAATSLPISEVSNAIAQLEEAGLIDRPPDRAITRRAVLTGGAGLGVALVTTIVLPTPAMASCTAISSASSPGGGTAPATPVPSSTSPGAPSPASDSPGSSPATGSASGGAHSGALAFTGDNEERDAAVAVGLLAAGAALTAVSRRPKPRIDSPE